MFTITDPRYTPESHETDQEGADEAWIRFTQEGFVFDPDLCTTRDTVLVRGDDRVTITYSRN